MTTIINISKYSRALAIAAIVISSVSLATVPAQAHAGNFLDPFCLWSCGGGGSHTTTPPATTGTGTSGSVVNNYYNTNTNTNTNTNANAGTPVAYNNPYPTYPVYPTYPTYSPNPYPTQQLSGNCYSTVTTAYPGQNVTWYGAASGGNGNYTYSWNGTDGFSSYGPTTSMVYYNSGTKVANITISSQGQTISVPCSNSVVVYGSNYNNNTYTNYGNYYNTLNISCTSNTSSAPVGGNVIWTSNVSGGNGNYTYQWSGTDNLYGTNSVVSTAYSNPGTKTATVTVYSNGQTGTAQCVNPVTITGNQFNSGANFAVACAADAARVGLGTTVTWSAEVSGGNAPYTYSWSGTSGLLGSQSTAAISYSTTGTKSAVINVTSADGRTVSASCQNNVTVVGGGTETTVTRATTTPTPDNGLGLSALSLFSLSNIPWGWIAVLIILVLIGTVIYLVFNKNKI